MNTICTMLYECDAWKKTLSPADGWPFSIPVFVCFFCGRYFYYHSVDVRFFRFAIAESAIAVGLKAYVNEKLHLEMPVHIIHLCNPQDSYSVDDIHSTLSWLGK